MLCLSSPCRRRSRCIPIRLFDIVMPCLHISTMHENTMQHAREFRDLCDVFCHLGANLLDPRVMSTQKGVKLTGRMRCDKRVGRLLRKSLFLVLWCGREARGNGMGIQSAGDN